MKQDIINFLKLIESENNIEIIFASDIGSRSIGYSTEKSDYDIRFIYIQKPQNYLKIKESKENIQKKIRNYDFLGFDLKKTLEFISNSNVQIWQCFYSKKIYLKTKTSEIIEEKLKCFFNTKAILHQYLGLINNTYNKKIQRKTEKVKIKHYLLILVRLSVALYIAKNHKYPFEETVEFALKNLPNEIIEILKELLLFRKIQNIEEISRNKLIDDFINLKINEIKEKADKTLISKKQIEILNQLFYEIISEKIKKEKK